jgi:XTP/dITP diphosphohydrolase
MARILIATSNRGKLRDFRAAAAAFSLEVDSLPRFDELPTVVEDAPDFAGNARKKAEHYSRFAPGDLVLADDSGLEVEVLGGAPGVRSARYAADSAHANSSDAENNARLLRELAGNADRQARFVCVISAARGGREMASFRGEAQGRILEAARGPHGFGYDPLFFFPDLGQSFGELSPEEKARVSHRGEAFRKFLQWWKASSPHPSSLNRWEEDSESARG